ncbi:DNA polymerase III subunits gamma and tau [Neisseria animaloris]|uniref:DNA polymerase III subunit gamma/tau n=1 Tax=Neisseria animaloris TaxID=326522 RepID=UPI000A18D922|nr:DNA polymerase III subunit gamma/tau [Neisseria animaloris]OSI07497.1 DNA polymerase III subunit gamma/tau [Neisseria animaloris]VEH86989.1 DNA polymerase III subunits gamma and tau [Neisseria animaloris]
MAYQVLARKWRPKTFADLVGQEHVVKALRNALDEGRLHHAYLLTGTRGVGKTTIARILAKSLNCENANHGEPCGVCQSCTQIDAGRYVDLLEIDAASNTGIDNIREVLENAQYAPTAGKYKVYIIDEVHMLSKSAFNAMLKTLEEPPEHVKFILATTDPHKVPITVLSRCLQFVLRNMTTQQVADHLAHVLTEEQIPFEPPALQLLGRAAMGSMRDALSLLDQAIAMGSGSVTEHDVRQMIGAVDKRYLYELLQGIVNQDGEELLRKAQEMAARAIGFDNALSELAMLLQRLALAKTVPAAIADDPEHETLLRLSQYLSGEQIQLYYQCAIHGKQDLSLAPDEYAGFVMTLLRMLAFAPIAAKAHDPDGVIEGTQLHNPEAAEPAAKKPLILPETQTTPPAAQKPPAPAVRPSEKPDAVVQAEDTPPWEDAPQTPETAENGFQTASEEIRPSEKIETQTAAQAEEAPLHNHAQETPAVATEHFQTASMPTVKPSETAGEQIAAQEPTAPETPQTGQPEAAMPSESMESLEAEAATPAASTAHIQTASPLSEVHSPQTMPSETAETAFQTASDYPPEYADVPPYPDADEPPYFPEEYGYPEYDAPVMPSEHHEKTDNAQTEQDETPPDDEDEAGFTPLPEFAPENWAAIAKRFAAKLGAAQMLTQHAAWTGYDAEKGLMLLSLSGEARAVTNKERLDKIQNTLADAYGLQLKLQTEPWRDDAGWETPAMRSKRLQLEGRQKAQDLLEADQTARQILDLFEAEWLPDTLKLAESQE